MKALSLWQPWASAVAVGAKRIETRAWKTDYRGPLAIHAAKRFGPEQREFASARLGGLPSRLPLGAIVAVVRLVDCEQTKYLLPRIGPIEQLYGDYTAGRFGWIFEDVCPMVTPIPYRGARGLFEVPDAILENLR